MPDVSIVVPAYNEGPAIVGCLDQLLGSVASDCEVLVVVDSPDDSTLPFVEEYAAGDPRVVPTLNTYGRGPAKAIRFGMDRSTSPVTVVTMADGSDEVSKIDEMAANVRDGAVVCAASRYMRGGSQVGGPPVKRLMSRLAGLSLWWVGRVGTHDATNSFKAYSTSFVRQAGVESDAGFEIGLELVAKAKRMGLRTVEVPTRWVDRTEGASNFKLAKWLPRYLRWYWVALGPRTRGPLAPQHPVED